MISMLSGKIVHKDLSFIVVETGGVGYKVFISPQTLDDLIDKSDVSLWTHLAVRETSLDLYGFTNREELTFYEMLLTVSGIGPKSGLAILSVTSVDVLRSAISSGDTSYLTKVSGIGRKSAEKIVLELRDKLQKEGGFVTGSYQEESDVAETLKMLGYKPNEIRGVLKQIPKDITGTSARVKEALKILGK